VGNGDLVLANYGHAEILVHPLQSVLLETLILNPFCRKNAKGAPGLAIETWDPRNRCFMDTLDVTTG
jgi:hypothetical protein